MEEVLWRQKSRVLWLKEGDKNYKFFHQMANVKKRSNFIGRIRRGQGFNENPMELKEEIAKFFED